MKKTIVLVAVLAAVACKKPDDCERAGAAIARSMKGMPLPAGKSAGDLEAMVVAQCRKEPDAFKKDKDMQCILASKSESEEDACLKKGLEDYGHKSKQTEAELYLNQIAKDAKRAFGETGAFPIGKAKPLPVSPDPSFKGCCGGKSGGTTVDNKCPVTQAWASDPVWKALEFQLDEPTEYRYTYESTDGKSFTATAAGDLDCDMQEAVFTITGTINASGNPETALTKPAADVY